MSELSREELGRKAFHQFLDLWVTPEVKRRQEAGTLRKPLALDAFQIVWFPDGRPPSVRINRPEVKAQLRVELKQGRIKEAGESVLLDDVERFDGIFLTDEDDPDCGHATYLRLGDRWHGHFDAIYNKGLAKRHLEVGNEFQRAAEAALQLKHFHAFVDTLFSAAELYAKANLLLLAGFGFRDKATHDGIKAHYNMQSHLGNVDASHSGILNRLSRLRNPARYLKGSLMLSDEDAASMLLLVTEMDQQARRFLPTT